MPSVRVSIVSLFLALAAGAPCLGMPGSKPYRIAGASKDEAGKWTPAEVMELKREGVTYQTQYLTTEEARAALKRAIGKDLDLLPGRIEDRRRGYLVFVLQIDNGSALDVIFNPNQARLSTEKGDMEFALDYSALYEASRLLGPEAPGLDELATAFFDRAVSIKPAGSVRKLLAFEAPREDRYRIMQVRLAEVNVGASAMDIDFLFRKFFQK